MPSINPGILPPNDYVQTDDYKALRKYYEVAVNFLVPPADEEAAFARLEEAIAIKPDEAIYRRLAAQMLLREMKASEAENHLRRALEAVQSPSELAQAHLLLGFANDLLGRRDGAVSCYREALKVSEQAGDDALSCVNRFVIADAKKYSRTPFSPENAKKIEVAVEVTGKYDA